MTVTITLTLAGSDTGPFNLYSNLDGYTTAFQTNIAKSTLVAGLTTSLVPDNTTTVLVKSTGACNRSLYLNIAGAPIPSTTTTSSTSSTTSTTSTSVPPPYRLAQIGKQADAGSGCPIDSVLRIYLDATDYALFIANSSQFANLGGGGPTTCTAIARTITGIPISGYLYDNQGITWKLTGGSFTYNQDQC
jgi:hypothetical protein